MRHARDRNVSQGHPPGQSEGVSRVIRQNRAIGQEQGGHISPLAAYDAETDRFLILDVSRYKYPPGSG
jgi:Phytochelatin synthase